MIWQPSNSIKAFMKKQSLFIIIDVDRWCPGLSVEQGFAAVALGDPVTQAYENLIQLMLFVKV